MLVVASSAFYRSMCPTVIALLRCMYALVLYFAMVGASSRPTLSGSVARLGSGGSAAESVSSASSPSSSASSSSSESTSSHWGTEAQPGPARIASRLDRLVRQSGGSGADSSDALRWSQPWSATRVTAGYRSRKRALAVAIVPADAPIATSQRCGGIDADSGISTSSPGRDFLAGRSSRGRDFLAGRSSRTWSDVFECSTCTILHQGTEYPWKEDIDVSLDVHAPTPELYVDKYALQCRSCGDQLGLTNPDRLRYPDDNTDSAVSECDKS